MQEDTAQFTGPFAAAFLFATVIPIDVLMILRMSEPNTSVGRKTCPSRSASTFVVSLPRRQSEGRAPTLSVQGTSA